MELDITALVASFGDSPERFSNSVARSGMDNIGAITWRNACAVDVMLVNDETRSELEDHFRGYGAWSREELSDMSDVELNALLVQFVSGDYQEYTAAEEAGNFLECLFYRSVHSTRV